MGVNENKNMMQTSFYHGLFEIQQHKYELLGLPNKLGER